GEEFWEYRSSFPTSAANQQDPCTRVYPLNKWRMPTKTETKVLADRTSGRNLQPDYVDYDAVGVAAPYQGNKVRILKLGYFMTLLGPMDYRNDGYFWTHDRSEEHTSELQSRENLVCRLLLEKKKKKQNTERRKQQHSIK